MNQSIQTVIVLLIVGWSLSIALRRLIPMAWQQGIAAWLKSKGWFVLSNVVAPSTKEGGCGSGCHSCQSHCSSDPVEAKQAVQWRK